MKIFENGLDSLLANIEETTYHFFDGAEEIGSSDISCCVRAILGMYYKNVEDATNPEWTAVRNGVNNCIRMVLR